MTRNPFFEKIKSYKKTGVITSITKNNNNNKSSDKRHLNAK